MAGTGNISTKTIDLIEWRDTFAAEMVGSSRTLLDQVRRARRVADTDCSVLITGETGTGKEVMARAIHAASPRGEQPFVAINCGAIPEELIEDELFGHAAGAYTGAEKARRGRIASAEGGTLFLDEIGELPPRAQVKLLRVLQERVIQPVGSDEAIAVDIRVLAATHRDLRQMVADKQFRDDLLYRLEVIPIRLPPLRERGPDIIEVAEVFLEAAAHRFRRNVSVLSPEAIAAIEAHEWRGNVRELHNAIERAVLLGRGPAISPADLGLPEAAPPAEPAGPVPATEDLDLKRSLREREQQLIRIALQKTNGNRTEAAALLGLNRTTLIEKMKKSG
jgi:two-component system response regulator AtoC